MNEGFVFGRFERLEDCISEIIDRFKRGRMLKCNVISLPRYGRSGTLIRLITI